MRRIPALAAVLAAALPAAAAAQPSTDDVSVNLAFVEDTLPNGLRVIYHEDHATPVAATVLWYDVASKHEQPGRTGFAHLFEHLMLFTGSRNAPEGQHFALLEAQGARAGADINGTTSADRTNYFQQVPSSALELALWLEADRMATLDEALNEEKLVNQREVVKNERRQSVDNQPYGSWGEKMLGYLYPPEHPYHHPVLGSMADLDSASLQDVRDFFDTYYVPNNAVLVVAGDIDIPRTREMVRRYFGGIPRGPAPPPVRDVPLAPTLGRGFREVVPERNAPAPAVFVGYRVPSARSEHAETVWLLSSIIGDGRSSPLYAALVREQQIATNVFSFNYTFLEGADMLIVGAVGTPGASADSLEAALLAEMERIPGAIDAAGLQRVQAEARFTLVNQLQEMDGFGGRGDALAQGAVFHGDPGWVNGRIPRFDAVTVEALRALAAERLVADNRAVLVYTPVRDAEESR